MIGQEATPLVTCMVEGGFSDLLTFDSVTSTPPNAGYRYQQ